MTREAFNRLTQQLNQLKTVERPRNMAELKHARGYGDFRENAEYDYAKQNQSLIEAQIRELESQITAAKVVDYIDASTVGIGTRVKLLDLEEDEEMEFALVNKGTDVEGLEAMSPLSPIGTALMGRVVGDEVETPVPAGTLRLRILEIAPL